MNNGVVLFAFNNTHIDYIKQAIYCAKRVKQYLNLPVQLITDSVNYIQSEYPFYTKYIDELTIIPTPAGSQKTFYDGIYANKRLEWKNTARSNAYFLSSLMEATSYVKKSSELLLKISITPRSLAPRYAFIVQRMPYSRRGPLSWSLQSLVTTILEASGHLLRKPFLRNTTAGNWPK